MVRYFGPLNSPANETTVSLAGHAFQINKVLAPNIRQLDAAIRAAGLGKEIRDVGGFRSSKGASGSPIPFSMHQFGAAFDINEDGGPNGAWNTMTLDPRLVAIARRFGWFNGQSWHGSSRDGGHFQYMGGGRAGAPVANGSAGSSGGGSGSGSSSGGGIFLGGGMGSPNSTSEAANVAAALAGGMGGTPGIAATSAGPGTASSGGGSGGTKGKAGSIASISGGGSASANKALMKRLAEAMYGWGHGAEWTALDTLVMHESGYRANAQNPTSTAYGIGQFLDSTWKSYGPKTADPKLQEKYMLEYIHDRYTDPIRAWAQYYQHPGGVGWYSGGTRNARPGLAIVGERGPEAIVLSGGQQILDAKETSAAKRVAQMPWEAKTIPVHGDNHPAGNRGQVVLNFGPGSIIIGGAGDGGPGSGSVFSTANAAREIVAGVRKLLEKEDLYDAIAAGKKAS